MKVTAHRTAVAPVCLPSSVTRHTAGPSPTPRFDAGGPTLTDLVQVVLTLTVVGAVLAAVQLLTTSSQAGPSPQPVLRTSYGLVAVGEVTVTASQPDADKGMVGKGHAVHTGVAGGPGVRVNVPVTLTNESDAIVPYTPGTFRLDAAGGRSAVPQDSPLLTGELRPGAAVSLRLTFALPTAASSARLVVDGGTPAGWGLDLPAAGAPPEPMTPQDQPSQRARPAPADGSPSSAGHRH